MAQMIMHQNTEGVPLDPEEHLARDWTLFRAVEDGTRQTLARCWQAPGPVVVVGWNSRIDDDVIASRCRADGVRILRRFSGGGAVVLGPGCLNYTLVLPLASRPELNDVADSFRLVLRRVAASLDLPGLAIAGGTDLAFGGRKVSGNAQRRGRRALIHHGTLLYDFDPGLAARYLREPARQPQYRAARRHTEFIGNLPLTREALLERLKTALECLFSSGTPAGCQAGPQAGGA